jgi:hypothetical protein
MANRWRIPNEIEKIVLDRDFNCVYCGIKFIYNDPCRRTKRTWEHIINDININGSDNIALCCGSCNSSKGNKKLEDWLNSKYCFSKNINIETVAAIVKKHLEQPK